MLLPHKLKDYQQNWCSFSWLLGWAICSVSPRKCLYLEWGPGWSTKYALSLGVPKENIFSVESDERWFQTYESLGVNLKLAEGPKTEDIDEPVSPNWYNPFPGKTFDVILVDGGHKRDECVLQAASMLAPNGFVVVHDTIVNSDHRRASRNSSLKLVSEHSILPGTTLLSHKGRRLSANERIELIALNTFSYLLTFYISTRARLLTRLRRIV